MSDEVVERLLAALNEGWDGAVPGLPLVDTVKRVEGDAVVETLDRGRARRGADAAGVRRAACCARRSQAAREATDCSSLVEAAAVG